MNWEDLDKCRKNNDKIKSRISELSQLITTASLTPSIQIEDLESVRDRMSVTLKQGEFWLEQGNVDRYIYDLDDLLCWAREKINSSEEIS